MGSWNGLLRYRYRMLAFYVGIYLLLTLPFLSTSPLIWADEGLLSEISWRFSETGVFSQPLWTGHLGFEHFSVHPNYLYFLFLALSFKLLGVGIFQARLVSVVAGLFLIIFFYLFIERVWGKKQAQIATFLLTINPLFILSARIVRQEMVTTLFAFLAIGFIILGLKEKKNEMFCVGVAGVFAGMTILAHLNGVFVSFAGFVLIVFAARDWKETASCAVYFTGGIVLGLLPYLIFIIINWDIFFLQFSNMWSYRLPTEGSLVMRNMLYEPHRWLKGITTPIAIGFGVFAFFYSLPQIKKLKVIYLPLGAMIFCYTFFDYHKYYGYLLLLLPFFCILSGNFVVKYCRNKKTVVIVALLLFAIGGVYVALEEYKVLRDYESDYDAYCSKIKEIITEPGVILADNLYWFCFPDGNLRDIIIPQVWIQETTNMSSQELFKYQNISYVILDPELTREFRQNKAIFRLSEDYLKTIQTCTIIGEVEDMYYTRSSTQDHTTTIYKCNNA